MKRKPIHIEVLNEFKNPAGFAEFNLVTSALIPPDFRVHQTVPYKKWLWSVIRERRGPAYNALGVIARCSEREEIILLCYCPTPCFAEVVIKAIDWYLRDQRTPPMFGMADEEELNPSPVA